MSSSSNDSSGAATLTGENDVIHMHMAEPGNYGVADLLGF